jgi:hypothetical protein
VGPKLTLLDVVRDLFDTNEQLTIYASMPWHDLSSAIVATEPLDGGLPPEAMQNRLSYFLEVEVARSIAEDWRATSHSEDGHVALCKRLIHYATFDA